MASEEDVEGDGAKTGDKKGGTITDAPITRCLKEIMYEQGSSAG
jgi:hypothetical protein